MKTVDEIYQDLLQSFQERAGYSPADSCDMAIRLYAAAAQIQALSAQSEWVLAQSFPQTAVGIYLDHHATACGLIRTNAAKAMGMLRFSADGAARTDLVIEAGTVCMTAGEVRFVTTENAVLATGSSWVDVPAEAMKAGAQGNAAAGTVNIMTVWPVGIISCTNPEVFSGGMDEESDESLRKRVLESYRRLPNGANAAWYETTALGCEGVAAAAVVSRPRGIGTVDVYVASPAGIPEQEVLSRVQETLAQMREIAVDVAVKVPGTMTVNVAAEIAVMEDADFKTVSTAVEEAIAGWFNGTRLGKPVRMAELGRLIYGVEGVENYHLLSPDADIPAAETILPVLGTVTVTPILEA